MAMQKKRPTAAEKIREKVQEVAQVVESLDPEECGSGLLRAVAETVVETHRRLDEVRAKR